MSPEIFCEKCFCRYNVLRQLNARSILKYVIGSIVIQKAKLLQISLRSIIAGVQCRPRIAGKYHFRLHAHCKY